MRKALSELKESQDWLAQMHQSDRAVIARWLDDLRLVDADVFRDSLLRLVSERARALSPSQPIAVYVERELAQRRGVTQYAFHQRKTLNPAGRQRAMRSYGPAVKFKTVASMRTVRPEIGSEGVIATLVTGLQRAHRKRFIANAGPDEFRKQKINTIFVITDFVGSGDRARKFLDAFWRMPTVKSWRSLGLVDFHVLAYSATATGVANVQSHPVRPQVHWCAPCPSIRTLYPDSEATRIEDILIRYDPVDNDSIEALGYKGQGAMLVFSHSCPNNAPRVLYKTSRNWTPLFVGRSNTLPAVRSPETPGDRERIFRKLKAGSRSAALSAAAWSHEGSDRLLLLAAIKSGLRFREDIANATGLDLWRVDGAMSALKSLGWLAPHGALTSEGHRNLRFAGPFELQKNQVPTAQERMYYPKSLRGPAKR